MATLNPNEPIQTMVRDLLRSPRAVLARGEIDAALDRERVLRERFYAELREDQKAEFINGEVVLHSPVKLEHNAATKNLLQLLNAYVESRGLGYVGYEKILVSLTRNDYEPDIAFWKADTARAFNPKQMRFPAPDLVVEVLSPSTEAADRATKFDDYAAHGVSEYWIIDPDAQTVEQYAARAGRYELMIKARTGTLASLAVPGFEIPIRAIFDRQENLAALRAIVG
jgi:Uma2 family endonuclease